MVTIFVDDLDAHVAAIAARGLEPAEHQTYSNGVRKVLYRDPDGNRVGFGGVPLDARSQQTGPAVLSARVQREGRSASARRTVISFFTSALGRGRSIAKCRELLVIV